MMPWSTSRDRIAARLGALLLTGERVTWSAPAAIPPRAVECPERLVMTDRRLLLVGAHLPEPPLIQFGPPPPPPPATAVRGIALADVARVTTTPGTHRIIDEGGWSTLATLEVRLRDGSAERIGLRQRDADHAFDAIRNGCGLTDVPAGPAADTGPVNGVPVPGGDAWVLPLIGAAVLVLGLLASAVIAALR